MPCQTWCSWSMVELPIPADHVDERHSHQAQVGDLQPGHESLLNGQRAIDTGLAEFSLFHDSRNGHAFRRSCRM